MEGLRQRAPAAEVIRPPSDLTFIQERIVRKIPKRSLGLVVGAAVLAVSGCAGLPGSQQTAAPKEPQQPPPPYLQGLQLEEGLNAKKASTMETLLQVDPCALHDQTAIQELTGQPIDLVKPGQTVIECGIDTTDPADDLSSNYWSFDLDYGEESYGDTDQRDAAPVQAGGVQFYRSTDGGGHTCIYQTPIGSGFTASLQVSHAAAEQDPCQMGDRYLQRIAGKFADPPMREQQLSTDPVVPVIVPCQAIRAALTKVSPLPGAVPPDGKNQVGSVRWDEPARCEVIDEVPRGSGISVPRTRASIIAEVDDDPVKYVNEGIRPGRQVAGQTVMVTEPDPDAANPTCGITFRVPGTQPGSQGVVPQLRVEAPNCDEAAAVAESAMQAASA
ncbi:hypothetical protein [Saccharopolyspora griseoalba]|uniref:DUF3558 domain-containing protein n=1 Tax=Saccharopolyspora griseoalba TaxID=1431848 RepID=A0ABW2LSC5_9PSEU